MFQIPDPCMFCGMVFGHTEGCVTIIHRATEAGFAAWKPEPRCTRPLCKDEATMDKGKDGKYRCWRCGDVNR